MFAFLIIHGVRSRQVIALVINISNNSYSISIEFAKEGYNISSFLYNLYVLRF